MDALFDDFVALDKTVEVNLTAALTNIERGYISIFEASVKRTIEEWEKFSAKCPETVTRFIAEYEADSAEFMTKTMPEFLADTHHASSCADIRNEYRRLRQTSDDIEGILSLLAGNEDDQKVDIRTHITAKHRLLNKFHADKVNTRTLDFIKNDEDGAKANYQKISQTE